MPDVAASTQDGLQVLGLCRFSVPFADGFRDKDSTLRGRRAQLYAPDRLEQRFALFEHLLLPAIAAQKDPAFRLIILMGEDFPAPWRARMEAHVAAHPQLVAEYTAPTPYRATCAELIARHTDPGAEAVAQFRLDDDDAVAVNFTKRLRRDFRRARPVFRDQGGLMALDYGRGIFVEIDGGTVTYLPRIRQLLGVALAVVTTPGDGHSVYDHMHHKVMQHMATLHLRDEVMFLRGVHAGNDSVIPQLARGSYKIADDELRGLLRRRFRHDAAGFAKAIAALPGA